jgi:hypothetical protein
MVMLALMYGVTRRLFPVPFQWGRLLRIAAIAGGLFALGELLLPTAGATGLLSRAALVAAYPLLLAASGFFEPAEITHLRALGKRLRTRAPRSAETPQELKALRSRTELMQDVHDA